MIFGRKPKKGDLELHNGYQDFIDTPQGEFTSSTKTLHD